MFGNFSAKYLLRNVLTIERITGARIKDTKPATLKPGTKRAANQKHKPLTTKEKVPKLKILRGRDNSDITGFTPELTKPITSAATKAAGKFAKFTPGKIISTTKRLKAVAKMVKNEPNIILLLLFYARQNLLF
jgi:hypothetical protein